MTVLYSITNLTLKRSSSNDGNAVEATWGYSGPQNYGFDGWYDYVFKFNASKDMTNKVTQQHSASGGATGDIVWMRTGSDSGNTTSCTCNYNRLKYHPLTSGRNLNSVTATIVHGTSTTTENMARGTFNGGEKHTSLTMKFKPPKMPLVSAPDYDGETHNITFTITPNDEGPELTGGVYERYDTMVRIVRQDSANRNNSYKKAKAVVNWAASTSDSIEKVYKLADASSIQAGQWVKITCEAYSRGLAGNSSTRSVSYVFARPAQASITKITCSGQQATDYVTVTLKTNATTARPVDSVKLQRLKNSTSTTASAAGLEQTWADVDGAVDDGNCKGLTDLVTDAMPDVKKHTWYRLVTTHGAFTTIGKAVEAKCLYRAKDPVDNDKVWFNSIAPGVDGQSIACKLVWQNDDSDTTQISWSEYEDSWESTEQPNICDVTWEDATPVSGYAHSANVTVRGLEEGNEYYVRARRGNTSGDNPVWGKWCYPAKAKYPVSTALAPTDVVLTVPSVVERGSGIDCTWTFEGGEQTAWEIAYLDASNKRKVLVSGNGQAGATTVPASEIAGMDSVKLAVSVTTGGDWSSSDYMPVNIDDAPGLSMSVASTVTEQPVSLTFTTDNPRAYVTTYITSGGVASATPDGQAVQAEGDVVWAEALGPAWEASYSLTTDTAIDESKTYYTYSNGVYSPVASPVVANIGTYYEVTAWTATVTPPILKLYEGAVYTVSAIATDSSTFLSSDAVESDFKVEWSHRAVAPNSTTAITVENLTATIIPVAPTEGYGTGDAVAESDVVDVYRNTPDGNYLIASDIPFGQAVTDRYAPFSNRGNLAYTLCTRTADGDLDWADYAYELDHATLRVDFGKSAVELPYNLAMSDGWEKGFELREHLDGTRAGYWNEGATRKASLSTDVVKVESAGQRRLLAALAQYAGACFVRTPEGCAYPADVQVDSYGVTYESQAVPVSITATEVAITDAFRIAPSDWVEAVGESS